MAELVAVPKVSKKPNVRAAIEAGEGILRLAPAWVPRSFMIPGRRIKLHPDDIYALVNMEPGKAWASARAAFGDLAPEVIELKGITPAADIWSLGCTIIELITGHPPYFDMPSMSAMFRIVQDVRPPFPENISDERLLLTIFGYNVGDLDDFVLVCFRKNSFAASAFNVKGQYSQWRHF